METRRVAIIGAGVAGLTCARTLLEKGLNAVVFEQSATIGGRLSSVEYEGATIDVGSQTFTIRTAGFQKEMDRLMAAGIVTQWKPRFGVIKDKDIAPYFPPEKVYVGVPRNVAIAENWAGELAIRLSSKVEEIKRTGNSWMIMGEEFSDVVLACPAPRAAALLPSQAPFYREVAELEMAKCWVLSVVGESSDIPYDAAYVQNSPLVWCARNSAKPGRNADLETWVVQASNQWSAENATMKGDLAADRLLNTFKRLPFCNRLKEKYIRAHFWENSSVTHALKPRHLWDPELRIGCCGDWLGSALIEGAYLSGLAIAFQIAKDKG